MIAEIIINLNSKELDRTFDYNVPFEMQENIKIGSRVLIPFGNMKRLEEGFVVNFKENTEYKLKDIAKLEKVSTLDEQKVELAKWIANRYFCNLSEAIKLMLPPGTTSKKIENRISIRTGNFVKLIKSKDEILIEIDNGILKSEKQIHLLKFLFDNDDVYISDLEALTGISKAVMKTLQKNGYISIYEKQIIRDPFISKEVEKTSKLVFTDEQKEAYSKIEEAIDDRMNSEYLIFGVTGSRKNRNIFATDRKSN